MDLVSPLIAAGVRFASGVPDSTLRDFCWSIAEEPRVEHVAAACEGGAVALAMGSWITTGRPACVYMQNSGLPNALNPLMALAGPEAYDVPLVLVVGWRARPGFADEPQHRGVGRETVAFLRAAGVEPLEAEPGGEDRIAEHLADMRPHARRKAILVPPTLAVGASPRRPPDERDRLRKTVVLRILIEEADAATVFLTGIGHTGREAMALRLARGEDPFRDLPMVGGMGFAAQVAAGMAMSDPGRRVICVDGDGSFLMHAGNHAIVASRPRAPLTHIVLDNGRHASVGGHPTVGEVDLAAIGAALGYPLVRRATTTDALRQALGAIAADGGAGLIHVPIRAETPDGLPRPDRSLPEGLARFRALAGYGAGSLA